MSRRKDQDGNEVEPLALYASPGQGEHDPQPIAERLIASCEEFGELRDGEPTMLFLFRLFPDERDGKAILGQLCLPRFGGAISNVGLWLLTAYCSGCPDFVMVLDHAWWTEADPRDREALVFHELMHAMHARDREGELRFDDDGAPIWKLRPHDLEEFNAVVARYGAWAPDVVAFAAALRKGGAL